MAIRSQLPIIAGPDSPIDSSFRPLSSGNIEESTGGNVRLRIICVYSVEQYVSLEKPLAHASEIPFGIASIATVLKEAGHDVSVLVLTPETPLREVLSEVIRKRQPKLFCFTAVSTQFWIMQKASEVVKQLDASIFTVLGGHHASLNSDEAIAAEGIDAICISEGERAVIELARQIGAGARPHGILNLWIKDRATGELEKNPTAALAPNLDELPYIDRRLWDEWMIDPSDYPSVLLGRGCPFQCTYCSNHAMAQLASGPFVRFRSPPHIVGEISKLCRDYPDVTRIYLEVETFGANLKASFQVFDALAEFNASRERKIQFGINFALTSNFVNNEARVTETMTRLANANIRVVNVGLETGSERLRDEIKRPRYTNKELINFCQFAKRHGVEVVFYVLIGLPGETLQSYRDTIRVCRDAQPAFVYLSIFYPYLGTDLATLCLEKGLVDKADLSPTAERTHSVLNLPEFSRRRIRLEYVLFWIKVYRGHWPMTKLAFHTGNSILIAHPLLYSSLYQVLWRTGVLKLLRTLFGARSSVYKKHQATRVDSVKV